MEQVRIVASKDKQTISRLTRLSVSLVEEYLEIIKTYYCHVNSIMSQGIYSIFFIISLGGLNMKKYIVTLAKEERESLDALTSKGEHKSQKILNALILLGCDEGEYQIKRSTNEEIACILNISMRKIDRVKKRFVEEGIEVALNGRKGSRVYAKKADGDFEAHLVALSCSEPPEGFARWSLRLLADKVVELGYIDSISHEAVRRIRTKPFQGNLKNLERLR